jgi:outer membrane protein
MKTRTSMMTRLAGMLLGGLVIGLLATASASAAELKIGWVDLQRVINASAEGQRAQAEIQQRADEYTRQADRLKAEMEAMADDYKAQESMLTASARRERQDAIVRMEVEYNRFIQDSRDELSRAEQRTLQGLLQTIGQLVVEFGEQQGYAVILEAGNILYGSASTEVTNDIIALYNTRKSQ